MSGITHLPGPTAPIQSHLQHFAQAPPALHIAVPVLPPQSPIWTDSATTPMPVPSPQSYFVANPSTVITEPHTRETQHLPNPRPRKPYTTTKVREMWTTEEHERMLEGLRRYKRDWAKVTSYVGTRSAAQVRSHAQKYFDRVARDKTDEYVPRARPKRKSTAPYPRKVREDNSNVQPSQTYHPPVTATFPVPVVHPATTPFEMQPVAFASPQLHHPVRIAPGQAPIISQVSTSPYVAQPQQHTLHGQVAVPHGVYSPFMEPNSNPHGRSPHLSTEIQASPLSYVSSQPYAAPSPSITQQTISIPAAQMYGMLSPLTPGAAFSSMTHTPVTVYGQPGIVRTEVPNTTPRHSHPEGPVDNCAKCVALQRYGAVLQEIGDLNGVQGQPEPRANHGKGHSASSPMLNNAAPARDPVRAVSVRGDGRKEHAVQGTDQRQPPPSSSGAFSPRGQTEDGLSPACSNNAIERYAPTAPAGHRAQRAKIMRARKLKQRKSASERPRFPYCSFEDQSESANSTQEKQRQLRQGKDSTLSPRKPSSRTTGPVSRKRKMASKRDNKTDYGVVGKKQRSSLQVEGRRKGLSGPETKQLDRECQLAESNGQNEIAGREGSSSRESGPRSPLVETYSPKERMELFDAVHSLQILAKTSSSGSPSSGSKGDPRGSEDE